MSRKLVNTGGLCLKRYKVRRITGLFMVIGSFVVIGWFFWWRWAGGPVDSTETKAQMFVVSKGESAEAIGRKLKDQNLIRSSLAFKLLVMKLNLAQKIQAGDFRLNRAMTLTELAGALTRGTLDLWVTLPEGWRREQIGQKLAEELTQENGFDLSQFLELTKNLEGKLFPDTYLIAREATATQVVKLLTQTFSQKAEVVMRGNKTGLSQAELVTLASMVEREASGDQDRGLVAAVLYKRLRVSMGLDADATLQYILGTKTCGQKVAGCQEWWPMPEATDRQLNSPFNTYKFRGLPPAPIANPGVAAIRAVVEVEDTPYLYYLHDSKGQIHLAKTLTEHQENIGKFIGY